MQRLTPSLFTARSALLILAAVVLIVGAGCGASSGALVQRASFDLNCPPAQIQVVELSGGTRGVRGCGQQTTYVEECAQRSWTGERHGCDWRRDAPVAEASGR